MQLTFDLHVLERAALIVSLEGNRQRTGVDSFGPNENTKSRSVARLMTALLLILQ